MRTALTRQEQDFTFQPQENSGRKIKQQGGSEDGFHIVRQVRSYDSHYKIIQFYQEDTYQVVLNPNCFVFYGFCAAGMLSFDAHAHGIRVAS
jgi:hypothetical protein